MSSNVKPYLVDAVNKLYGNSPEPIEPAKICKAVCKKAGIDSYGFPPELLADAIWSDPNYIPVTLGKDSDFFFISQKAFLNKAQFCIKLTAFEIAEGILFSGHRFVPFFGPLEKIKLLPSNSKKAFKNISKKYPMNDIMIYYTLLGPKGMLDVLTIEHEDNVHTFMAAINPDNDTVPSNHMKVTVYNMKEFFQQNQLSANDMLLLSIKDYDKKICEVNVLKQETLKERAWERAEWLNLLSKGIKKSIASVEAIGEMEHVETFLARALYFGGSKLITNPPANITSILTTDGDFEIKSSPNGYALPWEKNRPFDLPDTFNDLLASEDDDFDEDYEEEAEEQTPFNEYCRIMGFSYSQNEIEAYIRDELFSNAANLADASVQNVINRCFDSRIEEHYPDLKEPFFDELNIIWKSVSSKYNIFKDSPQGKIRKRALEVIDQHNTWIRELDKRKVEITPEMEDAFRSLMQIMAPLYSLVVFLNSDEEIKEPQLKKFINMLDVTKSVHKMKIQEIDDPLKR